MNYSEIFMVSGLQRPCVYATVPQTLPISLVKLYKYLREWHNIQDENALE